jgi:hypothetical protein
MEFQKIIVAKIGWDPGSGRPSRRLRSWCLLLNNGSRRRTDPKNRLYSPIDNQKEQNFRVSREESPANGLASCRKQWQCLNKLCFDCFA